MKPKLLAIKESANRTVLGHSAHPSLISLRIFVKQINKDLIDFRDTFTKIGHLLYGNTTEIITASLVEMTTFSFHILSQRDKFSWIDTHPIQPTDVDTIITSLRNIDSLIDTNALTIIDTFAQNIELRDNPRAFNLSRSSSGSSSSSSSSDPLNLGDLIDLYGSDVPAPTLANASGKKYRKTKVKRRRNIKATHRRPLVRANSRKHRK